MFQLRPYAPSAGHRFSRQVSVVTHAAIFALFSAASAFAATFYIAPNGSDNATGSQSSPFKSISHAQSVASSGDTVFLRGGTYTAFNVASSDGTYHYVHTITKNGISYLAFAGETPVLNFASVMPSKRVCAFLVTGSNNIFRGFEVTGIKVGGQEQSECFRINSGHGNQFLGLKLHDCPAIGIYIQRTASDTLVEGCDAYNLVGLKNVSAGNIDGFGCHSSGSGNVFRNCRSWHNSDDGYDCINAAAPVTFDHCWAFNNGVNGGNGNGFKVGGWGNTTPPNPVPVHIVKFCLSAENSSHGFYANHQCGQAATWTSNTSYNNGGPDFDMLERVSRTNKTDINGTREVMHANLAYKGTLVNDLNESGSIVSNNSWTKNVSISASDFRSENAMEMTTSRAADGSLPTINFMHLVSGSDLVGLGCFP